MKEEEQIIEAVQKEIKKDLQDAFIEGGKFIAESVITKLLYIQADLSRNKYKEANKRVIQLIKEISNVK